MIQINKMAPAEANKYILDTMKNRIQLELAGTVKFSFT